MQSAPAFDQTAVDPRSPQDERATVALDVTDVPRTDDEWLEPPQPAREYKLPMPNLLKRGRPHKTRSAVNDQVIETL